MKKIIIIVGVFILLAGSGVAAYLYINKESPKTQIEDILPQNALFYINVRNFHENADKLAATEFWKGISKIKLDQILQKANIPAESFVSIIQNELSKKENQWIKHVFSREFSIAAYPTQFNFNPNVVIQEEDVILFINELINNLYLAVRMPPDIQAAEFISTLLKDYGENVAKEETEYNKNVINLIVLKEQKIKFAYTRLDDLVIFSG